MLAALRQGDVPAATPEDLPCFAPQALKGNPDISPEYLQVILASLGPSDIPTLECALEQLAAAGQPGAVPAWLGFKVVTDAEVATTVEPDAEQDRLAKGTASADGQPGIFVAFEDKRIVCGREYSARDCAQMLDITRGPHMHNEQYPGVAWLSLPLMPEGRVFILGSGEIAHYLERMAGDVGFETVVVDIDEAYLNPQRVSLSQRVLLESYDQLGELGAGPADYVLVLTRGHLHDPEALIYGIQCGARYVGMMGCATKNDAVFALAESQGITREQLEATHSPIGLKIGAKTPAELALCIVAELVQVRAESRKVG
jgi:xanthine dehydrogenase accessory factor